MLSFECDYAEGAHEAVLQHLLETNLEQLPGYGQDRYCDAAKEKIRAACACPDADVFFISGGTQTNQIVIDAMLRPHEGVIAADTGHKVLTIPHRNGKLDAGDVRDYLQTFYANDSYWHMVFPGMIYLSHPSEYGTLYTRAELEALSTVCREFHIPLFLDGARLGYALASPGNDVTLQDLAALCDAFYIGGTKVGALCGEAGVFPRHGAPEHFATLIKRRGALLAKGRLLGVQFDALFTDDLYLRISRNAIAMAQRLREGLRSKGYPLYMENPTNQIFVILDEAQRRRLAQQVSFSFWEPLPDGRSVVRFATSWATTAENVDTLIALL